MLPWQRWTRMIDLLRAAGFEVETSRVWYGVGSEYAQVLIPGSRVVVRMSDHAPKPGGGMRWDQAIEDYSPAGDADVSIHPHGPTNLRNVVAHVTAAIERKAKQEEGE